MEDERFSHIVKDPKFRRLPKNRQKIKIDKRFQSMFNDKKFDTSHKIDKRGRPINYKTNTNLKQFYELDSDEESDSISKTKSSEDEVEEDAEVIENAASDDNDDKDLKTVEEHDKQLSEDIKKKLRNMDVDYARGKSRLISESSSDDDDEDSEVDDEIDKIEHNWGELDRDADQTEEPTYRLAACNMDWDRIRAIDLMVLFNSFLPQNGVIKSVAIYPSEFGKSRIKEEEIKGPIELIEHSNNNDNDDDDDNEEGSKYHMEKLRQYQLNRLKYYYAVVTFDSANTANRIYTECDGMEYESSATRLDLRFIPDDMTFDDEPKEFCDKLPELNRYQPRFFTTTALQQAKVDLTWDETDLQRIEIVKKFNSGKIDEINEEDLKNYIASSSGSDDSDHNDDDDEDKIEENDGKSVDNKDTIEKYRKLLQEIENDDDNEEIEDGAMEMKWDLNLQQKTDEIVKQKQTDNEDKTPFQKYLDKRKEKRKERKLMKKQNNDEDCDIPSDIDLDDPYFAEEFNKDEFKKKPTKSRNNNNNRNDDENNDKNGELELLLMNEDDDDNGRQHFSLKKIQDNENTNKKKKNRKKQKDNIGNDSKQQDDFEINVNDDRFSALFTNHLYNIDQTDPHYKKTKGMETLINEKLKRRIEQDTIKDSDYNKKLKRDNELSMLVKSIKRKKK